MAVPLRLRVESGEAIVEKMKKIIPTNCQSRPQRQALCGDRGSDPDGNYFDISEHGFSM